MQDLRQSSEWVEYMERIGWEVVDLAGAKAYVKQIPILGCIIKIPRFNPPIPFEQIDTLARKQKAFVAKIEPNISDGNKEVLHNLKDSRYHLDNWSFAPTKTIQLDLTQSLEKLLSGMKKETRYAIRKAGDSNIELQTTYDKTDSGHLPAMQASQAGARMTSSWGAGATPGSEPLEAFIELYKQTAKRVGFWTGPIEQLQIRWEVFSKTDNADLFLASQGPALEAGAVVFYHDKIAYYYHAASSEDGQKLNAPSLIIWEIIKTAKKRGCVMLDFEGIKDSRIPSTRNWEGFSRFKRGFGGKEEEFVGSFSKYYVPIIGPLFRFIQKLGV